MIFINKAGSYPEDAIQVQSTDNFLIKFHPMAGGFLYTMPFNKFVSQFELYDEAKHKVTWHKAYFTVAEYGPYEGYTTGHLWNGWACPHFTKKVADQIMADYNIDMPDSMQFEDNKYIIDIDGYPEEPEICESYWNKEVGATLYAIGDGWCWDEEK